MVSGHTTTGGLVRNAPKNHRAKVALKKVLPKRVENPKTALFLKGERCSQVVQDVMTDFSLLKKPHAHRMTKKNEFRPFEESKHLEFLAFKNDASLFAFGSHSKASGKRPHNLVLGRHYDYQLLDMVELGVTKYEKMRSNASIMIGSKPMFLFHGELFKTNPTLDRVKNIFLDFFRGKVADKLQLLGLDRIITVTLKPKDPTKEITVAEDGASVQNALLLFRQYNVALKKSGTKIPKVELVDCGPTIDFEIRRVRLAAPQMFKHATRLPKGLVPKKEKNVTTDAMGEQYGQIFMEGGQTEKVMKMGTHTFKAHRKRRVEEAIERKAKRAKEQADGAAAGEAPRAQKRARVASVKMGDDSGPAVMPKGKRLRAGGAAKKAQ